MTTTAEFDVAPDTGFGPLDVDVDDTAPNTSAPISDVPACTVCGKELIYGGRGRKPTKCDEHKKGGAASGARPRTAAKGWAAANTVEEALNRYFQLGGGVISFVNPQDGQIIARGGPAVSKELVELARTNKHLRDQLELIAAPGKYGPLAMAVTMGIVVPIMANHGLLPQFRLDTGEEIS